MSYPDKYLYRGSKGYIQIQIDDAGYTDVNVYVYYTNALTGPVEFTPPGGYSILANHIDEDKDADFFSSQSSPDVAVVRQQMASFVIAESLSDYGPGLTPSITYADIPLERKEEFRELLLRIKPTTSVALLYVNYV
jgi:hypothetical protein